MLGVDKQGYNKPFLEYSESSILKNFAKHTSFKLFWNKHIEHYSSRSDPSRNIPRSLVESVFFKSLSSIRKQVVRSLQAVLKKNKLCLNLDCLFSD